MGWKLDYFQKVSVFENLSKAQIWPKRKYHLFSHLIWRKFQVFDKGLGNFENGGPKKMLAKMTKIKLFQIAWNGEKIGWNCFLDFTKVERSEIIGERSEIIGERSEVIGERSEIIGETDFWILPRSSEARLLSRIVYPNSTAPEM